MIDWFKKHTTVAVSAPPRTKAEAYVREIPATPTIQIGEGDYHVHAVIDKSGHMVLTLVDHRPYRRDTFQRHLSPDEARQLGAWIKEYYMDPPPETET
jgi:hypothetical protein